MGGVEEEAEAMKGWVVDLWGWVEGYGLASVTPQVMSVLQACAYGRAWGVGSVVEGMRAV